MDLIGLQAKISSPAFSLANPESFQIAETLPVPQPSALVGALAYCIALEKGTGARAFEEARRNTIAARASIETSFATISPIILRRFRVIERGFEAKKESVPPYNRILELSSEGRFDEARRILERLTDALYREYLGPVTFRCVWILREPVHASLLYSIQRLGDTESLCTVTEATSIKCKELSLTKVKTRFPFPLRSLLKRPSNSFMVVTMEGEDRGGRRKYVVPCKRDFRSTRKGTKLVVYSPSQVEVEFGSPVICYEVNGELIVK